MKDKPQMPMLPWFPANFHASTRTWPLIARAIYRELLDAQWDAGGIPSDQEALRRIVGASVDQWCGAWPLIQPKFELGTDGLLRNPRLEQHRIKSARLYERHRTGAEKTNSKRWGAKVTPFRKPDSTQ